MVWDHRQPNHAFHGIVMQEFDAEQRKLVGKKEIIFKGTDVKLTEAPHLYKINGFYYLLTAEGGTRFEHQATIARAENIWGPYTVHPSNPLISLTQLREIRYKKLDTRRLCRRTQMNGFLFT